MDEHLVHKQLDCGIECGVYPLPERHVVTFQIRVLAGACVDPPEKLGLARMLQETIDKGTESRSGRQLSDAFDAIGASRSSGVGRETTTFSCTVLPEHVDEALALHVEMLTQATFPQEAFRTNLELARQELLALQDDAHSLADKYLSRQALGPILGRHSLGEAETLQCITQEDMTAHWKRWFVPRAMQITVAGPLDQQRVTDTLDAHFGGADAGKLLGREPFPLTFDAKTTHYDKDLEQVQVGICWPGVDATHDDFPIQRVMLGLLSNGMSGRLFTELREKLALVYWVGAWQETPRGSGLIFLGASSRPDRCQQTYDTLLREVDRLDEDITEDELQRAITGIVATRQTRGDSTRSRCAELASDLFLYGHPVPSDEKVAKVQAVTIDDIKRYLTEHARNELSVVTLGPVALNTGGHSEGQTV